MSTVDDIRRKNFRIHFAEGALYISSGALLSPQTVFPALLARLGAGNLAIGVLPVVAYLFFYLPQLFSADLLSRRPFRKPMVIGLGLTQRLHIAGLALVVMLFGRSHPPLAIALFFIVYASSQLTNGLASPAWYDFTVKTVEVGRLGILMGLRTSVGAALGFVNGFVVALLLASLVFPFDYGLIIALGFLLQLASVIVQRRVTEWEPSAVRIPARSRMLLVRIREILLRDRIMVRFLAGSALIVIAFSGVGFLTVSALRTLSVPESVVGVFTVAAVGAQVLSGVALGVIADRFGNKASLVATGTSLAAAELLAAWGGSVAVYTAAFTCAGVNLGAEMMARYNFMAECAPADDRPLYVALMSVWLAPWYLCSVLAGWIIDGVGYRPVFIACATAAAAGVAIIASLPNPRFRRLAVSSK